MNLKNRLSVKIQHTSKEHLDKLENLYKGEHLYEKTSAAFEWHLTECHELLKDCLNELNK